MPSRPAASKPRAISPTAACGGMVGSAPSSSRMPGRLGGELPGAQPVDLGAQLGDEAGQVGLLAGGRSLAGGAGDAGLVDEAGEEALALPLEQPDALGELGLAVTGALELAAGARQLGGGGGLAGPCAGGGFLLARRHVARRRQLALQLREPALEVDDLLERSSEQPFRISAQPRLHQPIGTHRDPETLHGVSVGKRYRKGKPQRRGDPDGYRGSGPRRYFTVSSPCPDGSALGAVEEPGEAQPDEARAW